MATVIFSTKQSHPLGKRRCAFCTNQMKYIDYKDIKTLKYFINGFQKIKPRYYSGVCLRHQKMLSKSVKRSREMGLLPFVNKFN